MLLNMHEERKSDRELFNQIKILEDNLSAEIASLSMAFNLQLQ
jgi:hypothetical protein